MTSQGKCQHGHGQLTFPDSAHVTEDLDDLINAFTAETINGASNGVFDVPAFQYYLMGDVDDPSAPGNQWRSSDVWPPPGLELEYYFHGDGSLSPEPPLGSEAISTEYVCDPDIPVPTIGGGISAADNVMPAGGFDQRGNKRFYGCRDTLPLSARSDVLTFQTPELDEAVEVTGPLTVNLWASSSAVDTDFTVKLIDVHPPNADFPDGFSQNISDSIIRARYRNSRDRAELLQPGKIHEFEIVMYPTSNVFGEGHRIRLDVSSSNFPRFDINPNTGKPLGRDRRIAAAENAIYHDPDRPSHIVLPIIPA